MLQENREDAQRAADELLPMWRLRDPCATYYFARTLAAIDHPDAIRMLKQSVEGGFDPYAFLLRDPWLDPLRGSAAFEDVMRFAEARVQEAATAFVAAGGETILGPLERA